MNCYRHPSTPALGICKTCFKGVCQECGADVGNGLACRGECEEKVLELNEMWERSAKIYGVGKHQSRIPSSGVLLWLLLSTAFWFLLGYEYYRYEEINVGSLITAIIFTACLGVAHFSAKRTGLKC